MTPVFRMKSLRNDRAVALLLTVFFLASWLSMAAVVQNSVPGDENFLKGVVGTSLLIAFVPLLALARFSFGYIVAVSFYCVTISFFWYSYFTAEVYGYFVARCSVVASFLMFLLPLLFLTIPVPRFSVSRLRMHQLLLVLIGLAALTLAWNACYGFTFVDLQQAERLRELSTRPVVLNYLTGIVIGAILPFAFAYFACQGRYVLAALSLFLIVAFYPAVLNKTVIFAAVWLPFLFLMFGISDPKRATILSLLIPMLIGVVVYAPVLFHVVSPVGQFGWGARFFFGMVNTRLFAFPAIVLDRYSEFFASHPLTHFCQIGFLRAYLGCPYPVQLGVTMAEVYHLGNLNGSLFATEGIASVGSFWAPLSVLVCGLLLAIGNSVSAHLPPQLLATSSGLAVQQALLNVPLSTSLLSNGIVVLWLLWFISPEVEARISSAKLEGGR